MACLIICMCCCATTSILYPFQLAFLCLKGLTDTKHGVFFCNKVTGVEEKAITAQNADFRNLIGEQTSPAITQHCSLVQDSDRLFATEYAYFVMEQMTTCSFTEADRLGKRKLHTAGFQTLLWRKWIWEVLPTLSQDFF